MYDLTWQDRARWRSLAPEPAQPGNDARATHAALLFWEEHCVECSIPECYSTCPLYVRRRDQKCARFESGIVPDASVSGLFPYGADIAFRRWGKLEATWYGLPRMYPVERVRGLGGIDRLLGRGVNTVADALQWVNPKRRLNGLHAYLRNRWLTRASVANGHTGQAPDGFLAKYFYTGTAEAELYLEIHGADQLLFRTALPVEPGWNERFIALSQMRLPEGRGRILIAPGRDEGMRVLFTWLDFVRLAPQPATARPAAKVKCVVWDLDNTLWDGVIGDAGPEGVRPNRTALEAIEALDARGIVQSIASKNTYEVAWGKIEELGLQDHFLYPAIHWGPKSQSMRRIAEALNINVDTLALVDDSAFERGEVSAALPQVRVYDAVELTTLLDRPEFDVPITAASRQRRLTYLTEARRKHIAAEWGDDYHGFLQSCGLVLTVQTPGPSHRARCLELIQRTNQLNLSTYRYTEEEFDALLARRDVECFAFHCADRFGEYGQVGFASVDCSGEHPRLRDFVLSCRVAQKGVEEAFGRWYARRARSNGTRELHTVFVPTDRNQPLREALGRLPFREVRTRDDGAIELRWGLDRDIALSEVVRVDEA